MKKRFKHISLMFADFCLVALAYFIVILLIRDDFQEFLRTPEVFSSVIITGAAVVLALNVVNFYSSIWMYTSIKEYTLGLLAGLGAVSVVGFVSGFINGFFLSYKYIFSSGFIAIVFSLSFRIGIKIVYLFMMNFFRENNPSRANLLIIGAGNAAALAIKDIQYDKNSGYNIVGVIDDDLSKKGLLIHGVKILGTRDDIDAICQKKNVNEILLAIPSISEEDKHEILNICSNTSCRIRILPKNLGIAGKINLKTDARNVQIEDLLSRAVVELDIDDISKDLTGKIILVTGGGGSIGSELCRQVATFSPKKLVIVDIYENNAYDIQNELKRNFINLDVEVLIASVRDINRLDRIFDRIRPEVVFHAAAHKHVPLMEDSSGEAIKNNIMGTYNTCITADKYKVEKFILISTDKAVNPTNIMGATKRVCEMIVQGINQHSETKFAAVRFGNVLGSNGSVVPIFKRQIENGGPVTITHQDITRYFMTIPEAAQLVMEAAVFAKGGEIFVLDMGKPVKIYDLAKKMIRLAGLELGEDIEIVVTGLRPGEKLYEELLMDEEGLSSTKNKKIFVARPNEIHMETLKSNIDDLMELAVEEDDNKLRAKLKEIVPSFKEPF